MELGIVEHSLCRAHCSRVFPSATIRRYMLFAFSSSFVSDSGDWHHLRSLLPSPRGPYFVRNPSPPFHNMNVRLKFPSINREPCRASYDGRAWHGAIRSQQRLSLSEHASIGGPSSSLQFEGSEAGTLSRIELSRNVRKTPSIRKLTGCGFRRCTSNIITRQSFHPPSASPPSPLSLSISSLV